MNIHSNKNPLIIHNLLDEVALNHPNLCLSRKERQDEKYLLGVEVKKNETGLVLIDVKAMTLWNCFLALLNYGPLNGIQFFALH